MPTFCLSGHAGYRCRSSGSCCRSGWEIPVEEEPHARIMAALSSGSVDLRQTSGGPVGPDALLPPTSVPIEGAAARLGQDASGACLFLERPPGNLCTLHRQLGPAVLPAACRQFPRQCVLTPRGVFVTLSHYCPTVADSCLDHWGGFAIASDAAAFPSAAGYEGLDARKALPPLLRPDALMCWESYASWEKHAVATLGRDDLSPDAALSELARAAEAARAWKPEDGPFLGHLRRRLAELRAAVPEPAASPGPGTLIALYEGIRRQVPGSLRRQVPPADLDGHAEWVVPHWHLFGPAIRRFLAGRAFASWVGYQGQGLRSVVLSLVATLAVLRVEASRHCRRESRPLDGPLLSAAFRQADLTMVHLAGPQAVADWLAPAEERGPGELLQLTSAVG